MNEEDSMMNEEDSFNSQSTTNDSMFLNMTEEPEMSDWKEDDSLFYSSEYMDNLIFDMNDDMEDERFNGLEESVIDDLIFNMSEEGE